LKLVHAHAYLMEWSSRFLWSLFIRVYIYWNDQVDFFEACSCLCMPIISTGMIKACSFTYLSTGIFKRILWSLFMHGWILKWPSGLWSLFMHGYIYCNDQVDFEVCSCTDISTAMIKWTWKLVHAWINTEMIKWTLKLIHARIYTSEIKWTLKLVHARICTEMIKWTLKRVHARIYTEMIKWTLKLVHVRLFTEIIKCLSTVGTV
jgi:hypothetical protein